jgi:hypothetical protein
MLRSSANERINRLRDLTETLDKDNNRQDKAGMMKTLSQEFARHIEEGNKCKRTTIWEEQINRLIAESLHEC